MHYFPAFLKLDNTPILIVGGGKIATEKIEKLLDFTTDITVIAMDFEAKMRMYIDQHNLTHHERAYAKGDVEGYGIVIIAVDDIALQKTIFEETRTMRTLCNAVDSVDYCDFIFPAYIREGDLTVAISTSGASPAVARELRHYLRKVLPDNISPFLEEMKSLRTSLPKGKERMQLLSEKAKAFFKKL